MFTLKIEEIINNFKSFFIILNGWICKKIPMKKTVLKLRVIYKKIVVV